MEQSRFDKSSQLNLGNIAAEKVLQVCGSRNRILDIGGGSGRHSLLFAERGNQVTYNDFYDPGLTHPAVKVDVGDFMLKRYSAFDVTWISHVLEHQTNVNAFLRKVIDSTWDDGLIAITVPPAKQDIVSGHYTLWNAGLVLYNLVMAGINTRNAAVLRYGYNISVLVRKEVITLPKMKYDYGDLTALKGFFPIELEWGIDSFNGDIGELNWN